MEISQPSSGWASSAKNTQTAQTTAPGPPVQFKKPVDNKPDVGDSDRYYSKAVVEALEQRGMIFQFDSLF